MKTIAGVLFVLSAFVSGDVSYLLSHHPREGHHNKSITAIGTMSVRRFAHSSTLLPNGTVLIAGGQDGEALATAEVFDPITKSFTDTGRMHKARSGHTATLLPNGKVLIAGGYDGTYLSSAEIYDPRARQFTAASSMTIARSEHEAILLRSGKVLLIGGVGAGWSFLASAEIYDPETGVFTPTASMTTARESHTATLLGNGKVVVTGGHGGRRHNLIIHSSSEVYDPSTGRFAPSGNMATRRHKHDAVLLADGRVLVTGGADERDRSGAYVSSEIYDPNSATFIPAANMNVRRYKHRGTSVLLPSSQVLVVGGSYIAELYDPSANRFIKVDGSMGSDRLFSRATLLHTGSVLITGGYDQTITPSSRAWLYR